MVYVENGKFKRYERKRGKNKVTQIGVSGLSVNSKFADGEDIIVISKEDFTDLENQLSNNNEIIQQLENELKLLKENTPETIKDTPETINKVMELQEIINNRNGLLMETQNTISTIIMEVNKQYEKLNNNVNDSNNDTKENIRTLIDDLQNITGTVINYCNEIKKQVDTTNLLIDNTSWFKWIKSKGSFKIVMDWDKIDELEKQLIEFNNTNVTNKVNEVFTPVEIPATRLENLDLSELYINFKDDTTNEPILSKIVNPDK